MASVDVQCRRCGKMVRSDEPAGETGPLFCAKCARLAIPPGWPMANPRGRAARPADEDDQLTPIQAALAWLMPWAASVTIHLAAFIILMFIGFTVVQAGPPEDPEDPRFLDLEGPPPLPRPGPAVEGATGSSILGKDIDGRGPKGELGFVLQPVESRPGGPGGPTSDDPTIQVQGPGPGGRNGTGGPSSPPLPPSGGTKDGNDRNGTIFGVPRDQRGISRVFFLVDQSGSMNANFDFVKAELNRSIEPLVGGVEFHVVMFSDGPLSELTVNGRTGLRHASPANKTAAAQWIGTQFAGNRGHSGQTDPRPALKRVFDLVARSNADRKAAVAVAAARLKADPTNKDLKADWENARDRSANDRALVFFLTDGLFPQETVQLLTKLNVDGRVVINTIGFCDETAKDLMSQIARENGPGGYRLVREEDLERR